MSDTYEKQVFAENLRGVLEATGCSQQQLAEVLGVSEASVSLWLSATHYPKPGKIQMMADYFGIRKSQLIDPQEKMKENVRVARISKKLEALDDAQLAVVEAVVDQLLKGGVS